MSSATAAIEAQEPLDINESTGNDVSKNNLRSYVLYNYGAQRAAGKSKDSFPFNKASSEYTHTGTFLRNLYEKTKQEDTPWILSNEAVVDYKELMLKRIGDKDLKPESGEPVDSKANPWWRFIEIWRVLNVYRTLTQTYGTQASPVDAFLKAQGTDALTKALYPDNVQALLRQNETKVSGKDWSGRAPLGNEVKPFPGVQVAFAQNSEKKDFNYYQEHPIGPMSIEAAFMLAAQLAGVDWKTVTKRWTDSKKNLRESYWFGGYLQGSAGDIWEVFEDNNPATRLLGRVADKDFKSTGNPDGGFYFALDLDPDLKDASKKNVFILAVHTVDPHSRVSFAPKTDQMKLLYKNYDPTTDPKPVVITSKKSTIFFSHAHSAVMKWTEWKSFLDGGYKPPPGTTNPIPQYKQVGQTHFYILSENDNNAWPRYTDFQRGANASNMAEAIATLTMSSVDGTGDDVAIDEFEGHAREGESKIV